MFFVCYYAYSFKFYLKQAVKQISYISLQSFDDRPAFQKKLK